MKRLIARNNTSPRAIRLAAPLLLVFCGSCYIAQAQSAPTLSWAKSFGGVSDAFGQAIALDNSGNVYTTGNFAGTIDFDPGSGSADLTSQGSGYDVYISKLDAQGNYVWARQIEAGTGAEGRSVATDASGNVYATGYFRGTANFNPGGTAVNLTSAGAADIYISKLDAQGNHQWTKSIGGGGNDQSGSITTDGQGNIYVTGWFEGTVDFDPGSGTTNLTAAGAVDIFVCKLNAQGQLVWAKSMGGSLYDYGRDVVVDGQGNVYVTGNFEGTANFDTGNGTTNLTSGGLDDIFIAKLDSQGDLQWAKGMGGTNPDYGKGIAVDASGNVYTTGWFTGAVDFDPGSGTFNLVSFGAEDIFVCKLDAQGGFLWAQQMGSSNSQMMMGSHGQSIDVDASGNAYVTGYFRDDADFGATNLTSAGEDDIFISKLDPQGSFIWSVGMGGTGSDRGSDMALDASGNIYTTGSFELKADFDPGQGTEELTTTGENAAFVHKLSQGTTGIAERTPTASNMTLYPAPFAHQVDVSFTLSQAATATLSVTDISGRNIYTQAGKAFAQGAHTLSLTHAFLNAAPGLYTVTIELNTGEHISRKVTKR